MIDDPLRLHLLPCRSPKLKPLTSRVNKGPSLPSSNQRAPPDHFSVPEIIHQGPPDLNYLQ